MGLFNNHLVAVLLSVILLVYLFSEYSNPNLHNINTIQDYTNSIQGSNNVISERLKDPNTLEQEMIDNMYQTTSSEHPRLSPRYQPLLPNMAGASIIE